MTSRQALLAAILALAACAGSRPPPLSMPPALAAADRDRDGTTTRIEWNAESQRLFAALDANGDGRIDATEMRDHGMALDANGDGAVDATEAPGVVAQADTNQDGAATPSEIASADWESVIKRLSADDDGVTEQQFDGARDDSYAREMLRHQGSEDNDTIETPMITVWSF